MKFADIKGLKEFIAKEKIFTNVIKITDICLGGSSFNFRVDTKNGSFLLKLLKSHRQATYNKLKYLLAKYGNFQPLPQERFGEYFMLAQPYISGHKLGYKDCTPQLIERLLSKHQIISALMLKDEYVLPQQTMSELSAQIDETLTHDNSLAGRLLNKYFWQRIKPELISLQPTNTYIHGDFTANNILIDSDNFPHILDVESVRYGYPVEDICYLFLQLSGFRGFFGNINRFHKLKKLCPYSNEQYLYGVQMFYLNHLKRRICNQKKHKNFRKQMCLLVSLMQYFRVAKSL